jgi:hypothetical protein
MEVALDCKGGKEEHLRLETEVKRFAQWVQEVKSTEIPAEKATWELAFLLRTLLGYTVAVLRVMAEKRL